MVATRSAQCVTQHELAKFAAGNVSVDQLDSIAAHVDTCGVCQATISSLQDQPDSFVRDLRELPADTMGEESACQAVVQQLVDRHATPPRSAPAAAEIPSSIGGYRVIEPVGAGGMGIVYKAQHPKLKRLVAIKLLPVQRWAGPAAVARFEREMEVSGGLDHPNIVRASDAGDQEGMHYLVMDFVDGLDLSRLVRRMGPLPVADACEIIRQAASGLSHVHSSGLVHRDIKPSNVMVTQDGRVKILDLGLAMLGEQYLEGENNLTTIGQLMGTLDYMAPEQAADSHQVDARADVYSLGATLFHMLTGQAPYGGARYNSLLKKVLALANAPVPAAVAMRGELPVELDEVVGKCLTKDPTQRYSCVEDVAAALAPFAATASLSRLMEQASAKPEPDPFRHSNWSMAAILSPRKEPADGKEQVEADGDGKRFGALKQLLGAAAAFAFIVLAVLVVRVATDRGELVIRSADPDARILIRREGGEAVKELTLEQGKGKITIRSGQYVVELLSDADRMMIDKRQFIISRGDRVVLTVQEQPVKTAKTPGAVYEGMGGGYRGGYESESSSYGGSAGGYGESEYESDGGDSSDYGGAEMGMGAPAGGGAGMSAESGGMGMAMPGGMGAEAGGSGGMMSGMGGAPGMGGYGGDEYSEGEGYAGGEYEAMSGGGDYGAGSYSEMRAGARVVYDEKSYNDWMRILMTERNPERLLDAVQAITVLAPEGGSEQAAAALLNVMRAYGINPLGDSTTPGGKLGEQIMLSLLTMEPNAVAKSVQQEVLQGNTNSRQFLLLFVRALNDNRGAEDSVDRVSTALAQTAPEIIPVVLKMCESSDLNISRWAVRFASTLVASLQLDIRKFEGLEAAFQKTLKSKEDDDTLLHVAGRLSGAAPETPGLPEALLRLAGQPSRQSEALAAIGRLGPHGTIAIPKLMELVAKQAKAIADSQASGYGMEGSGGGGYPGGGGGFGMDGGGGYGMGGRYRQDPASQAISVLEQCGPEAIPMLRKLAEQEGPYQQQAQRALRKLESETDGASSADE